MSRSVSINHNSEKEHEGQLINPFPGLRPFDLKEKHLFYGREGQSERVLELLTQNRFVAIIGPSGSGKSSLVNCGVIPQLFGGFLYEAGSRWKVARMHPGYSPIESLAITVTETFTSGKISNENLESESSLNYVLFTKKAMEIGKLISKLDNYKGENILIFIDQFEELFRFTSGIDVVQSEIDESLLLINLLVEALKQRRVPIYVAICIRSDFVGSCSNYQTLTEHINQSHYLVPQMTRDAYRSAITGPLSLTEAKISSDVLQEILNNTGDKFDQLPVLQHLMMRLYNYWKAKQKPDKPISIYDYKAVGGLDDALSMHAEELYQKLTDVEKRTCKKLFQTITESGGDNKGIRRPSSVANITKISESEEGKVIYIANLFRDEGNSLITPNISEELSGDSVLDITHEAVMRKWKRLKGWIEEESDAVQLYLRLADASDLYQSGKSGVWRPPELFLAINWRENFKPNTTWASQYHPAYMRSIKFLEISEVSYNEEEAEKERAKGREIRRTRWFAIILAIAAMLSVTFMINSFNLKNVADEARNEAEEQRQLAEANSVEAEKQKNIALQYAKELAEQKTIVEGNLVVAVDQRETAVRTADAAIQRSSLAESSLIEVSRDKEIAEQTTEQAIQEREIAESERKETLRENMILLAQALSLQSLEFSENKTLQALIAYQAYKFNSSFNGPQNDAGIYRGLKKALENLEVNYQMNLNGHSESARSIAYGRRNGELFSAGGDGKIIRWNGLSGSPSSETIITNNSINRILALSNNERWLICGCEGLGIQVFDLLNQGGSPGLFNAHQNRVRSVAMYSDNQHMLTSGTDNTILKWNYTNGENEIFFEANSSVQALAISGNDQYVAAGTKNGQLLLFSNQGNQSPRVLFDDPGNQILYVIFREKDNLLISGDQRGNA